MSKELSDYTSRDPVTLLSSIETMYRQFGLDTIADGAIPTMDGQGQRKRSISQGLIDLSFIRALTGNGRPGFKDIPSDILLKLGVASTDEDRGRWMLDKSFN